MHGRLTAAGFGLLASLGWLAASAPASAYPVVISLQHINFDDGGTAVGSISLNTHGFSQNGQVVTSVGSALPGDTYTIPGSVSSNDLTDGSGNTWIVLFAGAYDVAMWLEVAMRPDQQQLVGNDAILSGCETHTFEAFCPAGLADTRYIDTASFTPFLAVAEPASMALVATGLIALRLTRSRRTAAQS
jgi:hypothetical protein